MVQLVLSSTATWLSAGLLVVSLLSPASAMVPGMPYGGSNGGLQKRQFGTGQKWADIAPSRKLEWQPCYKTVSGNLQCARIIVPMDYDNCLSNQTVTLAVVKRPAQDTDNYLGPVFVNPGGPGGSGVDFVVSAGPRLHARVGLNHDIIGWDPRGVQRSTPKQACWANGQRRAVWAYRWAELDAFNEFDDPAWIRQITEQYKYEHKSCADLLGRTGILQHLHTAAHARDLDRLLTATGNDKLRFWGISWGSALATYYATLFPHRVGRILSEANVDVRGWARGDLLSELLDAPRHLDYFYTTCAADEECALHEPTADGVRRRLEALLEDLRLNPRVLIQSSFEYGRIPHLFTHAHARYLLDVTFRSAMFTLPQAAREFASLERSTNETTWDHLGSWSERQAVGAWDQFPELSDLERWDAHDPDYYPPGLLPSEELTQCADWPEPNLDPHHIRAQLDQALAISPTGGITTAWKVWCAGASRPKRRFEGPFGGNTSFPILFVNNWDIVTPVESAFRNAEIFPGSSVVTLDSYGHAMTMNSGCVNNHVLAYFQNGTVPEMNSTCSDIPDIGYGDDYQWPTVPGSEDWLVQDEAADGGRQMGRPPSDHDSLMRLLRARESRLW